MLNHCLDKWRDGYDDSPNYKLVSHVPSFKVGIGFVVGEGLDKCIIDDNVREYVDEDNVEVEASFEKVSVCERMTKVSIDVKCSR